LKTEKTHRLDSILIDYNDGDESKFEYDLEDERDIGYLFDLVSGQWVPGGFSFHQYDKADNIIFSYSGDWEGEYDHVTEDFGSIFSTYTYNDQGLLAELHTQNKEQYNNKTPSNLVSHFYNDKGLIESSKAELWSIEADSFALIAKLEYTYSDSLLDNVVRYNDDRELGFIATDSLIFNYNHNGQLVSEGAFERSTNTDDWSFGRNIIIEYNPQGQIARRDVQIGFHRNGDGSPIRVDSFFYQYHTYGSLKDITQIQTDTLNEVFVITFELDKEIQEHDSTVRYDQIKRLRVFEPRHEENHMILNYKKKRDIGGDIQCSGYESCLATTEDWDYFYSEITTTSTEEEIAIPPSLYTISPNPSDNIINIRTADEDFSEVTLQLTDMQGRQVFSQKSRPDVSIDISHIESGLYIYQVFQDEKVSTGKLVVSR
jgi:hypothetical protein